MMAVVDAGLGSARLSGTQRDVRLLTPDPPVTRSLRYSLDKGAAYVSSWKLAISSWKLDIDR